MNIDEGIFALIFYLLLNMKEFKAIEVPYRIVKASDFSLKVYPLIRNDKEGYINIYNVSPLHGRSFVVGKNEKTGRYIISKGNGLSYSSQIFFSTSQLRGDLRGALIEKDAIRDFNIGTEIQSYGIKTNHFEYVLELINDIEFKEDDDKFTKLALLQYSVECPYRICDYPFMPKECIMQELERWDELDINQLCDRYLIAADVIMRNIRIMREHGAMHNAIHIQNFTWALELLDFESGRTNTYPYENPDYESFVPELRETECAQAYEVANYISWCTGENINYAKLDKVMENNGFSLKKRGVRFKQ